MKEQIYVSIRPEVYRENKSNVLLAQAELLHSMKRIQNLKILNKQKSELKTELQKFLSSALTQLKLLKEKMPNPKIPKELQHHDPSEKASTKKKIKNARNMEIDEELQFINEKLRQLNS